MTVSTGIIMQANTTAMTTPLPLNFNLAKAYPAKVAPITLPHTEIIATIAELRT